MPTVPLLTPEVAPTSQGTPSVRLDIPTDAFGGAVGHALSNLGSSVEGAGDKIWARAVELQNLENDTQAKKADANYMIKAGQIFEQFKSLEGNNAHAAYPQYIQDLQSTREQTRDSLANPMQQKMFDSSSVNVMGRNINYGSAHAGQQLKVAANGASQARIDAIGDSFAENPQDDLAVQRGSAAIRVETQSQGEAHGWSPEQTEQATATNISTAASKRITGLARTDPFAAQRVFDSALENKALTPIDAQRVQATIQTQARQAIPRGISGEVNADLDHPSEEGIPERSLEDRIAEGKAKAQAFSKNDPLLPDFVEQRIIADYNRSKSIQRDFNQRNEQTVAGAMMTGNKEGILPKSVDELKLINPDVAQAWDSMKPTTQKKYMKALANNANGDKVAWTDDGLRNYQSIKGQAIDAPVEFLARDIVGEGNLPNSAKRELINLQGRLRSQSESDPRVGRAMQLLGPDLSAVGIDKRTNKDGYYQFVGALQDQLDQYQTEHKKVPPADEVRKIGAQLMQEQNTHWWQSSQKMFETPIPDEEAERLKADPYWAKNNITPNDAMLRRIYTAQKFKELYGGAAKKPAEAAFPPNIPASQ